MSLPQLPHQVSIIVPTYQEALNLRELSRQINTVLTQAQIKYEIIFVDDNSGDGSVQVVDAIVSEDKIPATIVVRTAERGLSSAVLRGFEEARYETLLVMDADLQHNPSYIPSLVNPIINGEADFSVGSRHTEGGGIENWAFHRKLISWGATLIARPLVPCTDPMSGFFALSKNTLGRAKVLNPLGYKIGLELMVRCDVQKIQEVPIIFKDRTLGVSKLNIKTNALYLLHVSQLYLDCKPHYVFVVGLCLLILILFIGKRALFTADNHLRYTNTNGDGQRSVATQRDITSIATTSANDRAWDNSKPSSSSSASSLDKPPLPEQQQTNNQHTHKPKTKKLD